MICICALVLGKEDVPLECSLTSETVVEIDRYSVEQGAGEYFHGPFFTTRIHIYSHTYAPHSYIYTTLIHIYTTRIHIYTTLAYIYTPHSHTYIHHTHIHIYTTLAYIYTPHSHTYIHLTCTGAIEQHVSLRECLACLRLVPKRR
jgi:hypothetical protein